MSVLTQLPPIEHRQVLGVWRLLEIPEPFVMTRSIEQVDESFFFVARLIDEDGTRSGGTHGVPLERLSERVFQNLLNPSITIQVSLEGDLSVVSNIATIYGVPAKELWPD